VNQLYKEPNEAHDSKTDSSGNNDLCEFWGCSQISIERVNFGNAHLSYQVLCSASQDGWSFWRTASLVSRRNRQLPLCAKATR